MSKITSQKVKRVHFSLFQNEYDKLESFSRQVKSPMSKIIRELIRELLNANQVNQINQIQENNNKVKTFSESEMEF